MDLGASFFNLKALQAGIDIDVQIEDVNYADIEFDRALSCPFAPSMHALRKEQLPIIDEGVPIPVVRE
jgi:hypothetical protein